MRFAREFLLLGAMVLVACGGSTENTGDGGNGNDGSTPTDGSMSTDGSMNNDGGNGQDSGGGNSTPGKVDCGMMSCMAGTQICCVSGAFSDAGPMYNCQSPMMQCQGARLGCDEAADCMMGAVCCGGFTGGNSFGSRCSMNGPTCGMGSVQLCKTNQECGDAGSCNTYTCPLIGKVQACTKPFMQCM